jgi:AraC-like DNA-binding protein
MSQRANFLSVRAMTASRPEHSLPAAHALHVAELVESWGVPSQQLLDDVGLRTEALTEPGAQLPIATCVRLIERARELTGEPALGVHLGMRMRASAHGYLGFAAMSAATVREALELAMRFSPTRTTALELRLHEGGSDAALIIEERADFGPARDFVLTALVVGIWQIGHALTSRPLAGRVEFAFPALDYLARFRRFGVASFGQPVNRMLFDASVLDLPLVFSDRVATRLAREQCERELDALRPEVQLSARVRGLLAEDDRGFLSLEQVAARMHVSARTLKRRLSLQGVAFSTLLEEEQRDRALVLLQSPELSVDEVAERVGYSDAANFTRAFRRWTGTTPAAYRRATSRTSTAAAPTAPGNRRPAR